MGTKTLKQLQAEAQAAADALAKDPENEELKASSETAAAALAEAEANAPASPAAKGVEVRVLVDHLGHRVNDVIKLPPEEVESAKAAGWADDAPAAVKYAKSLAAK